MHVQKQPLLRLRGVSATLMLSLGACDQPPGKVIPLEEFRNGVITFYDADGAGHCSFDPSPFDLDVAAVTQADSLYGNATWCGSCAEIEGPLGTVLVRIVDSCPECQVNHLDLSPQAFAKIAKLDDGLVNVRWRFVSCPVRGNLRYFFKPDSTPFWTAIQVRNHSLPITKFEWWKDDTWVPVARTDYNYFEIENMGTGPIRLRVTASSGQALDHDLPGIQPGGTVESSDQFSVP